MHHVPSRPQLKRDPLDSAFNLRGLSVSRDEFQFSGDIASVKTLDDIRALPSDTEAVLVHVLDDSKLRALTDFPHLRVLYTNGNCSVSDAALPAIATMRALEALDLEWDSEITDEGLKHLATASGLRWLDLGFCENLTPAGVAWLRRALPKCEIDTGAV